VVVAAVLVGIFGLAAGLESLPHFLADREIRRRRDILTANFAKLNVGMTRKEMEQVLWPASIADEADLRSVRTPEISSKSSGRLTWEKAAKEGKVLVWRADENYKGGSGILAVFPEVPSPDSKAAILFHEAYSGGSSQKPADKWVVNKDNFLKLEIGMTLKELEDIIGVGVPVEGAKAVPWKNDPNWHRDQQLYIGWQNAAKEYRVYRWDGGATAENRFRAPVIRAAFASPPSATAATKVEALSYRDGRWDEDKGALSGAK
jgi:hypothetical protein